MNKIFRKKYIFLALGLVCAALTIFTVLNQTHAQVGVPACATPGVTPSGSQACCGSLVQCGGSGPCQALCAPPPTTSPSPGMATCQNVPAGHPGYICGGVVSVNTGYDKSSCTISGRANLGGQTCNSWDSTLGVTDSQNAIGFNKRRTYAFTAADLEAQDPFFKYGVFSNQAIDITAGWDDNGFAQAGTAFVSYSSCTCKPTDVRGTGCGGSGVLSGHGTVNPGQEIQVSATNACKPDTDMNSQNTSATWGIGTAYITYAGVTRCQAASNPGNPFGVDFVPTAPGVCSLPSVPSCRINDVLPKSISVNRGNSFTLNVSAQSQSSDQWKIVDANNNILRAAGVGSSWSGTCSWVGLQTLTVSCADGSSPISVPVQCQAASAPTVKFDSVIQTPGNVDCTKTNCAVKPNASYAVTYTIGGGAPDAGTCIANWGSSPKSPCALGTVTETVSSLSANIYSLEATNSAGKGKSVFQIGPGQIPSAVKMAFGPNPQQVCAANGLGNGTVTATASDLGPVYQIWVVTTGGAEARMSGDTTGNYDSGVLPWVTDGTVFQARTPAGIVLDSVKVSISSAGCPAITPTSTLLEPTKVGRYTVTGSNPPFTMSIVPSTGVQTPNASVSASGGTFSSAFNSSGTFAVVAVDSKGNVAQVPTVVASGQIDNGGYCSADLQCISNCCSGNVCSPPSSCVNAPTGSISANPNVCTISGSSNVCTSYITWDTSGASGARVLVSDSDAQSGQVYASNIVFSNNQTSCAGQNCAATWIGPKHVYTFVLYALDSVGALGNELSRVVVSASSPNDPNGSSCLANGTCASDCCFNNVCSAASKCNPPPKDPNGTACTISNNNCASTCCFNNVCSDASSCVSKKSDGSSCTTAGECSSDCCSGNVCSPASSCASKKPNGSSCTAGSECTSTCCSGNVCSSASSCASKKPDGSSCTTAGECSSDCCSGNVCSLNSVCSMPVSCDATNGYSCDAGGSCVFVKSGSTYSAYSSCLSSCAPQDPHVGFRLTSFGCAGSGSCDPALGESTCYSTVGACMAAFGKSGPGVKYDAASQSCAGDPSGRYQGISDCETCNVIAKHYTCNPIAGSCSYDPFGFYSSQADCSNNCKITYSCNPATQSCFDPGDGSGIYSSTEKSQCDADCVVSAGTSYNCNTSGNAYSCSSVSGNGGTYNSKSACDAGCCVPKGSKASGFCCAGTTRCVDGSCGSGPSCNPVGPQCPDPASLSVFPGTASIEVGTVSPAFKANYYPTGEGCSSATDVTNSANWTVTGGVMSVVGKGIVKGEDVGQGALQASYSGLSSSAAVTVTNSSVSCSFSADKTSITIPPPASVNIAWSCSSGSGNSSGISCVVTNSTGLPTISGGASSSGALVFPTSTTVFSLDCTNASGKKTHNEITVKVRNVVISEPAPR